MCTCDSLIVVALQTATSLLLVCMLLKQHTIGWLTEEAEDSGIWSVFAVAEISIFGCLN